MKKVLDFKCPSCGHITEAFTDQEKTHPCEKCGSTAVRMLSAPAFHLEGVTGSFPTAASKWDKRHT